MELANFEQFSEVLDSMPFGVMIVGYDRRIRYASKAAISMMGHSFPEDILGEICHSNICPAEQNECPVLDLGKKVGVSDKILLHKDGLRIPILKSVTPIILDGQEVLLESFVDVSDRQAAQQRLDEYRKQYEDFVNNLPIGCYRNTAGSEGHFVVSNPALAEMFGYDSVEEFMKQPAADQYVDPEQRKVFSDKLMSEGKVARYELKLKRKDGTIMFGQVTALAVRGESGQIKYFDGCMEDVTDKKNAEMELMAMNEKLTASNKQLEEFAYIASHDLREPLRKISSFGAMLKKTATDKLDADEIENLDYMIDGSKRMQQMIEALLMYSRLSTKQMKEETIDLNQIVEQLTKFELAVKIEETGSEIIVPKKLLDVTGDVSQVRQLLQNLIANAIKYQKPDSKPRITVSTILQDDEKVRVEVADNGIGIQPGQYSRAFEMFRRVHVGGNYEGTGIGLAACKLIVERHGGKIGVTSEPGEGSTFYFTMPSCSGTLVDEPAGEPAVTAV